MIELLKQYQYEIIVGAGVIGAAIFILVFQKVSNLRKRIDRLYGNTTNGDAELADNIVRRLTEVEMKSEDMETRLRITEAISKVSIQKVGFHRFNPFQDTGGDNSFAVALLNNSNNGVIIYSLYTREGVRIYSKRVQNGQTKQQLSAEEKHVLAEAMGEAS